MAQGQINLNINANASNAKKQLDDLQKQLQQISNMKVDIGVSNLTPEIEKASQAAMKLSTHLATATNPQTGNLDFSKFYTSIKKSGSSLKEYGESLTALGPQGQKAFANMAGAIAKAEVPLIRTGKAFDKMWDGLKRTAGWQLQSTLIHGIVGGVQKAFGYAKDLNKSLTDIRIVTGSSADEMARFAQRANEAAKKLSTTTTDYTRASLIYYQQGLSDAEVKARTEATIKMANATGTSAQQVSDQMTAIWNNYADGSKSLTHYADVMTALGAATASSTDEIAEGLQKFASISNTVGLSYEYAASALATITAESRESADVVGNALKTLFSRIQGLQLGETLDDGTTLNKYSTALAKVGISIKDQSGGLKDMDDILDEMGSKWDTLARDEKMALAQTVAGVRQYTQLMTLMENWDDFKTNLNTAQTSAGTLDSQAAIYAESWEAATQRVRSSWEGLWDTMINSDGMITILDGVSALINGLDKLAKAAGGAKGVISSFVGLGMRAFSPQLTEGLRNISFSTRMLFGGESAMQKEREAFLKDASEKISVNGKFGDLYGEHGSAARQQAIQTSLANSLYLARDIQDLNPEQKEMYLRYQDQIVQAEEKAIQSGDKLDVAKNERFDAKQDLYQKGKGKTEGYLLDQSREQIANENYQYSKAQLKKMGKSSKDVRSYIDASAGDTEATGVKLSKFSDSLKSFHKTMSGPTALKSQESVDALNQQLTELGKQGYDSKEYSDQIKSMQTKISNAYKEGVTSLDLSADYDKLMQIQGQSAGGSKFGNAFTKFLQKEFGVQVAEKEHEMNKQQPDNIRNKRKEDMDNLARPDYATAAIKGAQGLMSTVSMISALEGLGDQFKAVEDGTLSLSGILGSLASASFGAVMGFNGLKGAISALGAGAKAVAGPWAIAIMAGLTLLTHVTKQIDKVNVREKERINTLKQSDAELNSATESSKKLIETYQTQNNDYLESVEKVKTSKSTPAEFANEVFQANKQALDLISQYELDAANYNKNSTGLIEIDKSILEEKEEDIKNASASLERTSSMSGIITQLETLESDLEKDLSASTTVTTNQPYQQAQNSEKTATYYKYTDELGNQLTLDQIIEYIGTEKWDKIKEYAERTGQAKDYEELEKKVLEYQEKGILKDLAMRNNVDYLLQSQDYKVKGTESFAALGYDKYKEAYEKSYDTNEFSKSSYMKQDITENMKDTIVQYLKAQGFTGIDRNSIGFDGSDISKFTVKHSEGTEDINLEAIRKYAAEQAASKETEEVFSTSMKVLQSLYKNDSNSAVGLMSLLTGDNFDTVTQKEIQNAKDALGDLIEVFDELDQEDYDKKIQEIFGITTEEFQDLFGIDLAKTSIDAWFEQFKDFKTSAQRLFDEKEEPILNDWMQNNEKIVDNLSTNTLTSLYDGFKKASSLGGEDAGKNLLNGITEVLNKSNLDLDKYDEAVQGLLAIDWSNTLTSSGAAASVIASLGGELNTTTAAWQAFAAAMGAASGAIPDFSGLINQLTQLAGALQNLSKGDMIDEETYQQLIGMDSALAEQFSKHWSGKYTFIGDDNTVLKNSVWDKMNETKQQASKIQEEYEKYIEEDGNEGIDNNEITLDDLLGDNGHSSAKTANDLAQIATGKGSLEIASDATAYDNANRTLSQWTRPSGKVINGKNIIKTDKGFSQVKWNTETESWDATEITDAGEIANYEAKYQADSSAFTSARGIMQTILDGIHNLDNVSGEWKPEEVEQAVSTADNVGEVFDRIGKDQEGFTDEKTKNDIPILNDSVIKGLEALPNKSEQAIAAIDQLSDAQSRLEATKNENGEYDSNAIATYETAYANAELAGAIDKVAASTGYSAQEMANYIQELQQNSKVAQGSAESTSDYAKRLAGLAKEYQDNSKGLADLQSAYKSYSEALKTKDVQAQEAAFADMQKAIAKITNMPINKITKDFIEQARAAGMLEKALKGDVSAIKALEDIGREKTFTDIGDTLGSAAMKTFEGSDDAIQSAKDFSSRLSEALGDMDIGQKFSDVNSGLAGDIGQIFSEGVASLMNEGASFENAVSQMTSRLAEQGIDVIPTDAESATVSVQGGTFIDNYKTEDDGETKITTPLPGYTDQSKGTTSMEGQGFTFAARGSGAGASPGKSGGGGGGGGKEPKKVAQTRRSQVVKRYKNIDAKRDVNKNRRDNMSKKTDKLYGESRITNLQKENKLLEEGLRLNEKKAEEALKNLKIDEESLRKMTKKYGYELELDSEGNIKNYENILGDIYDEIHKLEADGLISESEEEIKEELEIRKQEIEGAMEDWEDTLKQLEELNNEYEELIDEMHSNELEQITYKLEFELELNELDTEWYDFLNEQIGDDFTQAVSIMDLITEKIKIANDNINLYKQSVTDLMENIENDPNRSLITGYLEDGVLTDEEAEILKEAYSGIIEQLSALAEAKTSAEELLVSIFEGYKERIDLDTTALEHYTSLLEHFGNVVDIVGQKQLGLSDQFMENMAKMRIQQSRDIMSAAQSELAAYEQIRAEAEEELARAREEGRTNDIDYWQQQLNDANTSIQETRDKLVTSFEDNLNAIADAFDKAIERIVQTFNDAVYAFGGLEGLSEDYSFIRENTELMAQDYEKIYELSKLNRNINKTLNDNNIIAGKQKMIELQKEINDLQASGAELSKYDLEYLQAKYELRLAEIELENAQNAKETVRLSKDSEGNWSYVYTASTEKIDEAQQKYEDALYKMQNLSYEYIDEMSEKIISASQAMMEEIQNLNKNNFENEQEYLAEINRIKAKYAESLGVTEEELNKALANNEELYDKDWQSYSNKTGYAISESQNWIDRYAESTLGTLMKSTSDVADYMDNFSLALDELTNSLYRVAGDYYNGIDDAFAAAGITKEDFASFVTTNTKAIMDASANTKKDIETQTSALVKEYSIQADKVTDIQRILDTAIDVYGPYIREIRDILKESAALTKELQNKDATYTYKQAADLFNSKYGEDYKIEMDAEGRWNKTVEGVKNEILQKHAEAKTDEEKKHYADMYTWLTSYILPYVTSLDTGGYTGEWGTSGRLAMLHEKELILNANDTANFLDALNVSRELVNRVIEMNARASSFGIGGLSPSSIQDFAQNLEQQVTITAEFPNAVDHNEIEEAFASLINTASQYANRK